LAVVSPASFIALNTGLSESLRRIQSDTASSRIENRNGIRQPHACQSASDTMALNISTTARLRMKPPTTLAWMKLV
jgi:hypothetical protein